MEKVKFDLKRIFIVSNLIFLLRMPFEYLEGSSLAVVVNLYLESMPITNFLILGSFFMYNQFLKGGVMYSHTGICVGKKFFKWEEIEIDLDKVKPAFFLFNGKIDIRSTEKKPVTLYINYFNEKSFLSLNKKYVAKENALARALEIYIK